MTDQDKLELLPCPFCGGEADSYNFPTYRADRLGYFVTCRFCDARMGDHEGGYFKSDKEATEAWNRRTV